MGSPRFRELATAEVILAGRSAKCEVIGNAAVGTSKITPRVTVRVTGAPHNRPITTTRKEFA
jgi:hypothetical protein